MENDIKNQLVEHARLQMFDVLVPFDTIVLSTSLALRDDYLFDLMSDWVKEKNDYNKNEMLSEIINYTDEIQRKKGL